MMRSKVRGSVAQVGGFGALICWRVALFERCWDENVSGVALQAD